jgi:uncharacterized protein (TIGR04141 family)
VAAAQSTGGRRLPLNAFLLRPGVTPIGAFADSAKSEVSWFLWNEDHLEETDLGGDLLDASAPGDVVVALTDRPSAIPPWQLFIREELSVPGFGGQGRALGAAVFCAAEDPLDDSLRWVAYSFGYASHAIRRRAVEPRFGLTVALNRIAAAQSAEDDPRLHGLLRQAAYRARGPYSYQAGYRAARDTPLESFRMDRLADLLSAAGGRVGSTDHPDQVFGARSLKTRDQVGAVVDLLDLANAAIVDFRAEHYRENFGFVDHMVPVYDEDLEDRLRQQLYDDVLANQDNVDVLLPDDLVPFEDERSICFIVRPGEREASAYDLVLTVEMVAAMIRNDGNEALDRVLRFTDSERAVIARAPIIDCLAAELELDGVHYVSYDGDFYSVDADLLARVESALEDVAIVDLGLPCYGGGTEAAWNKSVARCQPERFIVLDGEFIRLTNETPFEACDLLDVSGSLIHAKRKARSSSMSHLFVQAERSSELLLDVGEARDQMRAAVVAAANEASVDPAAAASVVDSLAERDHGLSVVLALLGDWHRRSLVNLPLLAKMSLVSSITALRRIGFMPGVALVPLCSRGTGPNGAPHRNV